MKSLGWIAIICLSVLLASNLLIPIEGAKPPSTPGNGNGNGPPSTPGNGNGNGPPSTPGNGNGNGSPPAEPEPPSGSTGNGSGCTGDCEAPTLGVDSKYNSKVTDGFSYNGIPTDVERFFTPYPLITVNVGEENQAVFKIYENHGPQNVKHFSLAFGLGSDEIISLSKARIELDIDFDGSETVTITDPENALDRFLEIRIHPSF